MTTLRVGNDPYPSPPPCAFAGCPGPGTWRVTWPAHKPALVCWFHKVSLVEVAYWLGVAPRWEDVGGVSAVRGLLPVAEPTPAEIKRASRKPPG